MKCYISHYSKNKDRLRYLENHFLPILRESGLFTQIILIRDFDRENKQIKQLAKGKKLPLPKVSNVKKHFKAWEIFSQDNDEHCLILEDDILFEERLMKAGKTEIFKELKTFLDSIHQDYNYITLGAGLHQHGDNLGFNKKTHGRSPDSYVISKKFLEYHDEESFEYDLPIGHYIDKILNENNDYLWWYEPTIFRQGSQNNIYKSSIFTQSEKIMMNINKLMMNINKLLK
jgi:GR25 family glycosyltransferase involved in LPS biosynthesis